MRIPVVFVLAVGVATTGLPAMAQQVIGAKSGVIHYVEGDAFAADQKIETKLGAKFTELKDNQVLKTDEGRAEVLLNPGVVLRVAESSSVKMINAKLTDTRVELLSGSVMIEVADLGPGNSVMMLFNGQEISFRKASLVRIDADPALLSVYNGEASVKAASQLNVIKAGKTLTLDGQMLVARFDNKSGDAFYRWGSRRASYIAMANVSTARSLMTNGFTGTSNSWYYNPYLGYATYIPMNGLYRDPWGFNYYSPYSVGRYYASMGSYGYNNGNARNNNTFGNSTNSNYNTNLGYSTASRADMSSSPSYSTPMGSSNSTAAPAAAPAASRGDSGSGAVGAGGGSSRGR